MFECRHKKTVCALCHKVGHLQRVCLSAKQENKARQGGLNKKNKKTFTNMLEEKENNLESDEDASEDVYKIDVCEIDYSKLKKSAKIFVNLKVNNKTIQFEIVALQCH